MKKYSVLTFVFGNYENIREPKTVDPNCEYVLVTDKEMPVNTKWTVKRIPSYLDAADGFTKSFYVRYHPFEFVTTDTCVVMDGSIQINKSLWPIVHDFMISNKDACFSINCTVQNSYDEFKYWMQHRNYPAKQARKSVLFMRALGYQPSYKGTIEATFKICRNTPITTALNTIVYSSLEKLGGSNLHVERLDQTILTAILCTKFKHMSVYPVSRQIYQSSYMTWCKHHSDSCYTKDMANISNLYWHNLPCPLHIFN